MLSLGLGVGSPLLRGGASAVPLLPVMDGLVAFWDWTGASPLVSKIGGHTLQQGAGSSAAVVDVTGGPSSKALSLNGTTDFLTIPDTSVGSLNLGGNGYNTCTVFGWVDRDNTSSGFIAGCWEEDADPRRQYGLFIDLPGYGGTSQVCGHVSKTGGATPGYPFSRDYSSNSRIVNRSRWQFTAFTYDGTYAYSYLGPMFDQRPTFTDSLSNTYAKNPYYFPDGLNATPCDFTVGAVKTGGMGNFFGGKIGPMAVYNRALSLAELTRIYRSYLLGTDPAYEFDFYAAASGNARSHGWQCAGASTVYTADGSSAYFGVAVSGALSFLNRGTTSVNVPLVGWSSDLAGVSLDSISSVKFTLNSGVTNSLLRLVILSGGVWYATDATFDLSTPGVSASDWSLAVEQTFIFGRQASKWRDLTFTPGSALSLAGSARSQDLPAGELQAIGFYSPSQPAATIRIDDLKVFAA